MRPRLWPSLALLGACQLPSADSSAFTTTVGITTAPAASSEGPSTSSAGTTTTTTGDDSSGSAEGGASTTSGPPRDLGDMPDFGDPGPAGCKGKIDFLFVISRAQNMYLRQAQLTAAFPDFIDAIQSKFDDFDYHIMVVDGDGPPPAAWWGNSTCNQVCPDLACKVGMPCCPHNDVNLQGMPCCIDPNYPCGDLDLVTECDQAWGAGTVFPAGEYTADKVCPIEGGGRYLVKGQTNLAETFECIARIGNSGYGLLGQALVSAMQDDINKPGGCNAGFLREDALLMVTFIATNPDQDSEGWPFEWAQTVIDAKHGDDEAVVMFAIGGQSPCKDSDRICQTAERFPFHYQIFVEESEWGPEFAVAASLVETACDGYTPPPG